MSFTAILLNGHTVAEVRSGLDAMPPDVGPFWTSVIDASALPVGQLPSIGDEYSTGTGTFARYVPPVVTPNLTALRNATRAAVNASCDAFRAQFVTAITAQDIVYNLKAAEADAITTMIGAGGDPFSAPNRTQFRFINDEAIAKGVSIMSVYQTVIARRVQWMELLHMTEMKRQGLMGILDTAQSADTFANMLPVNWMAPW